MTNELSSGMSLVEVMLELLGKYVLSITVFEYETWLAEITVTLQGVLPTLLPR
jgi:hypothetical protein